MGLFPLIGFTKNMNITQQTCTSLIQESGIDGIYKQIERAARTCYHSLDKITEDSAKPFVDRLIKSQHTAMCEHSAIYLYREVNYGDGADMGPWNDMFVKYHENPYSKVTIWDENEILKMAITANLRVLLENDWLEDLQYLCEPMEQHVKRYTLSCTTALHCYKDLTRHRAFSFAIESTRFCSYNKEKFNGQLTFIKPTWCSIPYGEYKWSVDDNGCPKPDGWSFATESIEGADIILMTQLGGIEYAYNTLTSEYGWKAQQAAEVLPQCIKGDMVITGYEDDWKHLLDLRFKGTTGTPHPMVKELATLMKTELEKQGFIYESEEGKESNVNEKNTESEGA